MVFGRRSLRAFLASIMGVLACGNAAIAAPELSEYARRPVFSGADLSPDGKQLSVSHRVDGHELLCIIQIEDSSENCIANMGYLSRISTIFLTDETVLVIAPEWSGYVNGEYRRQSTNTFSVNLNDGKMIPLPDKAPRAHERQRGKGAVVAYNPEADLVYMPMYDDSSFPNLDLFEVEVKTGRGRIAESGTRHTIDWFVRPDGRPIARENMDDDRDQYWIDVPDGNGGWRTIYSEETELIRLALSGVTGDGASLVFRKIDEPDEHGGVFRMALETGDISGPFYVDGGQNVEGLFGSLNRVFRGVVYSGIMPDYYVLDQDLDSFVSRASEQFPYASVHYLGYSKDKKRVLFSVEGDIYSGSYIVYDVDAEKFIFGLAQRPSIGREDMALVDYIEYPVDDGLSIPALLTFPKGYDLTSAKDLPTVVLPHGGPEAYDSIGYDWIAQALASRGYMVFQPNFRGSSGFGWSFAKAGRGQYGRAMQDDITEGVKALIEQGWTDPERICIAGWSYGGYAALAGGAFTPDLYKCVASIAGMADLYYELEYEREQTGEDSANYQYWLEQFSPDGKGTSVADLSPISPYYHVDAFKAPVLLMHGMDDGTVSIRQSERMKDAMNASGKEVRLIRFPRRGHSILEDEDREEVLSELISFIDQNIGSTGE